MEKPEITKREASWLAVTAAIRARKAAEQLGIDPEARAAMIHAASPAHPPIVLGTLWAIDESDPHVADLTTGSPYSDQALLCLTLLDPERVLTSLLAGDLHDVRCGIAATSATLTPTQANALERWFGAEMARLKHLAGGAPAETAEEVKKNSAAAPSPFSVLPAPPVPAG